MNRTFEKRNSKGLGAKLALSFAAVAILVSGILTYALYVDVRNLLRGSIEQRLLDTVSIAALQLDGDLHARFQGPGDAETAAYKRFQGALQFIRARSADIRNIYTLRRNGGGQIVYGVDAGGKGVEAMPPGTSYGESPPVLLQENFQRGQAVVENKLSSDGSGTWLKGYAPFFNSSGKEAGILAVDIAASSVLSRQRQFLWTAVSVFGLCAVLAGILGLLWGRKVAAPIEELTRAVRAITRGDLSHRAREDRDDETGELARAFNILAERLSWTQDKLSVEAEGRRAAQNARDLSEENYRRLYDNAYVGLFKTRFEDGKVLACNNLFARMLGFESSEDLRDVRLEDGRYVDRNQRQDLKNLLAAKGAVENYEALFNRTDGSTFWIRFSARLADEGRAIEGMAVDFTTEKTAIEQIKAAEKKYRSIFENAQEGLFQCTPEGRFVSGNPAMARILGYAAPEDLLASVDIGCTELFENPGEFQAFMARLRSGHKVAGMEVRFRKSDGSSGWGSLSAGLVTDSGTGREIVEGSLEDIGERKQAETMRLAKNQAEASNREKNRFLAALSHEMRTPMTAIIGMTELLDETALTRQQSQYVNLMKSANERLLSLISDIMDISRVEAGRLQLETIPFNLLEMVEKACETMAVRAHEKNLELACSISPRTPVHLMGDPYRLRQVLTNLMENAVKFTEKGEVVVTVRTAVPPGGSQDQVTIEFCVTDTGIGIPKEKLPSLFDHFARDDSWDVQHYGGTGVGLSISQKLVELMGGEFAVESRVDDGSSFCFTAVFGVQEKGAGVFVPASPLKGLSIIVADSDGGNRAALKEMLNMWGARVMEAKDGPAAIELLQDTWMQPDQADLILMDQDLPGLNGAETAGQIKMEHLCPACILMMRPDHSPDDLALAGKAGVVHFVQKPIDRARLLEIITEATKTDEEAEPGAQTLPPLDILLVEDSETNRFVIRAYLKNTPWRVDMAENGLRGVDKFKAKQYDLVLMDVQMPVMDGFTAIAQIREWETERRSVRTPIIATTIFANADDERRCLEAGADTYLPKPVKKNTLLAAILGQIIGGKKPQVPEPDLAGELFFPEGDEPILAWVDPEMAEMAAHYLAALPETVGGILDAVDVGDFPKAANLGQIIRDESKALGLEEVQKLGGIIHDTAVVDDEFAVRDCVQKLTKYLERVQIV